MNDVIHDVYVLLRRRRGLILVVVIGAVVGAGFALIAWDRGYEASAAVHVPTAAGGSIENMSFDLEYTDRLRNTYVERGVNEQTRDELATQLGDAPAADLELRAPANTELLLAVARSDDPRLAASSANALAAIVVSSLTDDLQQRFDAATRGLEAEIADVDEQIAALPSAPSERSDVEEQSLLIARGDLARSRNQLLALREARVSGVSVIEPAVVPEDRVGLPTWAVVPGAALAALLASVAIAAVIDRLDPRILDLSSMTARGSPVLGRLEVGSHRRHQELTSAALAAGLRVLEEAAPGPVLVAALRHSVSTAPAVAQLTRALATTGMEVLVVHRRRAHRPGSTNAVPEGDDLAELIVKTEEPGVSILAAGDAYAPVELLTHLRPALEKLAPLYDAIVVLGPPVLEWPDSAVLSQAVDGSILLVELGRTRREDLDEAMALMTAMPSPFIGFLAIDRLRSSRRMRAR